MTLLTPTPVLIDPNDLDKARKVACSIALCGGIFCSSCVFDESNLDKLDVETVVKFIGGHVVPNLEEKLAKPNTDPYNLAQFVSPPNKYHTVAGIKHVRQSHTPCLTLKEAKLVVDKWKEENFNV